jgi:prepilin-type N-terminal cleavage/methylation domain-containing protein
MKRKAFTLIELLVVISIIIVLVAILVPAVNRALLRATLAKGQGYITALSEGCAEFSEEHRGVYPGQKNFPNTANSGMDKSTNTNKMAVVLAYSLLGYYDFDARVIALDAGQPKAEAYIPYSKDGVMNRNGIVCCDKFSGAEMPILYYPATRGNKGDSVAGAFDVTANSGVIDGGEALGVSSLPETGPYMMDPLGKAYRYDSFLLVAAGADRKYFVENRTDDSADSTDDQRNIAS